MSIAGVVAVQRAAAPWSQHNFWGQFDTAGDLVNVAAAAFQIGDDLQRGDVGWVEGDSMLYFCTDNTPGAAVWNAISAAGPPIFPDGFSLVLTNSLNASDNINITRTFAGGGDGVEIDMGPGGQAVTGHGVNVSMGAGSTGHGLRVILAAGATGDGLHIEDSGSGPAIFVDKIGGVGDALDVQIGGASTLTVDALGGIALRSRLNQTQIAQAIGTGTISQASEQGGNSILSSVGGVLVGGDITMQTDSVAVGATSGNILTGVITSGGGTLKGFLAQIGGAALAIPAAGEIRVRAVGGADEFYEFTANALTKGAKYRSVVDGAVSGADITMESDSIAAGATSSNVIVGSISSGGGTPGGVEVRAGGAAFGTPGTGVVDIEATAEVNIAPTGTPAINIGSANNPVTTIEGRCNINRAGGLSLVLDVNGTGGSGVEIDTDTGNMSYRTTMGDLTISTTAPALATGGDVTVQALGTDGTSATGDVRIGCVDANATLCSLILRTGTSFPAAGAGEIVINADGVLDIDANGIITIDAVTNIQIAPVAGDVGFFGATPVGQSAAYTRNAAVVEDRTLLASASATTLNNNNLLAALIADLQAIGILG